MPSNESKTNLSRRAVLKLASIVAGASVAKPSFSGTLN